MTTVVAAARCQPRCSSGCRMGCTMMTSTAARNSGASTSRVAWTPARTITAAERNSSVRVEGARPWGDAMGRACSFDDVRRAGARKIARRFSPGRRATRAGVMPYSWRNTRPKCEASANPQRAPTPDTVRWADAGSRSARRHSCSRSERMVSWSPTPARSHSAYRCRTDTWCAAAMVAADRSRSARCVRTYSWTRSTSEPSRGAAARGASARCVVISARSRSMLGPATSAAAVGWSRTSVLPSAVEVRRDDGRERVVVRSDAQPGDRVDAPVRQGERAAGHLEVVELRAVGVEHGVRAGAVVDRHVARRAGPPGGRPARPSRCPTPGPRGTPSARGPAGPGPGCGAASWASTAPTRSSRDRPRRAGRTPRSARRAGRSRSRRGSPRPRWRRG